MVCWRDVCLAEWLADTSFEIMFDNVGGCVENETQPFERCASRHLLHIVLTSRKLGGQSPSLLPLIIAQT
jgi:hypothetical protein